MADAEGDEAEVAAPNGDEAEVATPNGADGAADAPAAESPTEMVVDEEDEEDEGLLSTPAFLKQKLKVLEKEMADIETQVAQARVETEQLSDEWSQKRTRLQGDFDNFRARHVNQTLEAQLDARIKVLTEFLPVLDNFDRARDSISPSSDEEEAINGQYEEMHSSLMSTLQEGLEMAKIEAVGQEFDYNMHMAIQQMPSDEYEENVVCSELQPGYTCKGKLVRAAYVIVSSG
jgi:molecular chaperone GrpE